MKTFVNETKLIPVLRCPAADPVSIPGNAAFFKPLLYRIQTWTNSVSGEHSTTEQNILSDIVQDGTVLSFGLEARGRQAFYF